ncbi:MAG: pseudouridine synthase, partial [Clostridium sp.]|nr:pseudouridine synthase [Clostridium sp.]
MERLDKVLANSGYGTRKEVKKLIKDGNIKINDKIIKSSNIQVDIDKDEILIKDKKLVYKKYIYLLMNKPSGVISATEDNYDKTVIDILNEYHKSFKPAPVGRLDKDTVGLLLITNDGELNHRMLAPKWHVDKVYYAVIDSIVNEEDILAFKEGITLDDGYKCKPGKLEIINTDEEAMHSSVK